MTTPNTPAGATTDNPSTATPQAGGGQTNTPSAAVPPVRNAMGTYKSAMGAANVGLQPSLLDLPPMEANHHAKVTATDKQVIDIAIAMLGTDPTLSGSVSADDLKNIVADVDACADVSHDLGIVLNQIESTRRLRLEAASKFAGEIVLVARKRAGQNGDIAKDVAEVDALRARGPTAEKAAQVAVKKQQKATRANKRATKANEEAVTATARATSLQHGTGGAVITQPAPTAPTTPTTPSAPTTPTGNVPIR